MDGKKKRRRAGTPGAMRRVDKSAERSKAHGHNAHLYSIGGEVRSIVGWCRHFGVVGAGTAHSRMKRGMSVEDAVKTPKIPQSRRNPKSPLRRYCEERGIPWKFVYDRVRRGMSVEEAVTRPEIAKDSPEKKRVVKVVMDGETMTMAEACRRTGVDPCLAATRHRKCGWSAEAAVAIPSRGRQGATEASRERSRRRFAEERRRELASAGLIV